MSRKAISHAGTPNWSAGKLADIATTIDLGDHMIVASGDARAGLRGNTAVLADTMEAVLGALYLDAGLRPRRALSPRPGSH